MHVEYGLCITNYNLNRQSQEEQTLYQQNDLGEKAFFRIFKDNKSFWEVSTIERRIGNMMYIVKGLQSMHKRHLNQVKRHVSKWVDSSPSEETVMDVIYGTFDIQTSLVAPKICHSKRKRKAMDLIIVNPKYIRY